VPLSESATPDNTITQTDEWGQSYMDCWQAEQVAERHMPSELNPWSQRFTRLLPHANAVYAYEISNRNRSVLLQDN